MEPEYLPVDNVQAIAASGIKDIPGRYLRSDSVLGDDLILSSESLEIPIIDMSKLNGNQSNDQDAELEKLHLACKEWGFFQLINHGVAEEVIQQMKIDVGEFFKLQLDEKKAYARQPNGGREGYGRPFIALEEQKLDWNDNFLLVAQPSSLRNMRFWPKNPESFSATLDLYSSELMKLCICLLSSMAKNLKLEPSKLVRMFETGTQGIQTNYYPECPQARNVMGLSQHSDSGGLTILLQANDVDGLQIRKDGKWVPIKAIPKAFMVNIGDIIQILSNGEYESIEHRVVVNPEKERLSINAFHNPNNGTMVGPLPEFIVEKAAQYKTLSYDDYMKQVLAIKVKGKNRLDYMKL